MTLYPPPGESHFVLTLPYETKHLSTTGAPPLTQCAIHKRRAQTRAGVVPVDCCVTRTALGARA